ncbi:MAG: YlxR family protein [Polyangiaceae bacterium]
MEVNRGCTGAGAFRSEQGGAVLTEPHRSSMSRKTSLREEAPTRRSVQVRPRAEGASRTCAGCQTFDAPSSMLRFVPSSTDEVTLDLTSVGVRDAKIEGRGARVHPRKACLEAAARKGFARSLRRPIRTTMKSLSEQVSNGLDARLTRLLDQACRERKLTAGASSVEEGELVVIARDASREAAQQVSGLVAKGRVMPLFHQAHLGALMSGASVEVITVKDTRIARAIALACAWAQAVRSASGVEDS